MAIALKFVLFLYLIDIIAGQFCSKRLINGKWTSVGDCERDKLSEAVNGGLKDLTKPKIIRNIDCYVTADSGLNYRGNVRQTEHGLDCQRWNSQSPHSHNNSPSDKPHYGLDENYCRNPTKYDRPWCYTTDSGERWQSCNIPPC